jgi:uncharacterized protein
VRTDIEFKTSDGVTLRGWHFTPEGEGPFATIIITAGYSMVKEMGFEWVAEQFVAAGLAALVYDHRNLGASEGTPRFEIDPIEQIRDTRDAITFLETLPATDKDRIGLWGTSYSGGHALVVSATDRRIKCVTSQVPMVSGHKNVRTAISQLNLPHIRKGFDEDRRARARGEAPAMIPIVAEDLTQRCLFPTPDSWAYFGPYVQDQEKTVWRNECTLRSVEYYTDYEPGIFAPYISPTPLLMIVALDDVMAPPELALAVYETALHPKKLHTLKNGHYDPYGPNGPDLVEATNVARDWFVEHLLG